MGQSEKRDPPRQSRVRDHPQHYGGSPLILSGAAMWQLAAMTKNRIVTVSDRYPEQTAQLKKLSDLFGKAGRI